MIEWIQNVGSWLRQTMVWLLPFAAAGCAWELYRILRRARQAKIIENLEAIGWNLRLATREAYQMADSLEDVSRAAVRIGQAAEDAAHRNPLGLHILGRWLQGWNRDRKTDSSDRDPPHMPDASNKP